MWLFGPSVPTTPRRSPAACTDPEIVRFTFMQEGLTEADAVEWIDKGNERWPHGHPRFAIADADDGLLGQVGMAVNAHHRSAEVYYWVMAAERRRGIASGALGLIADWAFSMGIERLFLLIHPDNGTPTGWPIAWGSRKKACREPTNRSRAAAPTSCRGLSCPTTRAPGTDNQPEPESPMRLSLRSHQDDRSAPLRKLRRRSVASFCAGSRNADRREAIACCTTNATQSDHPTALRLHTSRLRVEADFSGGADAGL